MFSPFDRTVLLISLGAGASLHPGDTLTILLLGVCAGGISGTLSTVVAPPDSYTPPQAIIIAPAVVSYCESLLLDGKMSTSNGVVVVVVAVLLNTFIILLDGRMLRFQWILVSPFDSLVHARLASLPSTSPTAFFNATELQEGVQYEFQLEVVDYLNVSSVAHAKVQ